MEYPKTLRFTSPYRNYRIFFVSPTSSVVDGELVRKPGKALEFKNNECICSDPEVIKLALTDGYYGKDYISPDWEKLSQEEKQNYGDNAIIPGKAEAEKNSAIVDKNLRAIDRHIENEEIKNAIEVLERHGGKKEVIELAKKITGEVKNEVSESVSAKAKPGRRNKA